MGTAKPTGTRRGGVEEGHRRPLWVKVFWSIALLLIVAFAVLHLAGGGLRHDHIPGSASPAGQPS